MTADEIVARLDGVRERGPGRWAARCPAHDDKSPSLSIRELEDATILLHCFAGCDPLSIVQSIGVEFSDLFPNRAIRRIGPSERTRLSATDALEALDQEVGVVWIIAADILGHRTIDAEDWRRLETAVARIRSARALCSPARKPS